MLRRSKLLFLFLCTSIAAPSQSPTQAPNKAGSLPTLKTRVRLVLVDVVVTDNKGDPVTGLHKDDFEISEDGATQKISTFEEHHGAPPTQVKLPPMPPNVYTNFPVMQKADSINILLMDALNTPSQDQVYVHSQMLKYLKTMPPNTRIGIFTLASRLRMLQGITTDSSVLLAVLNNEKSLPRPSAMLASNVENDANQRRVDFMTENQGAAPSPDQTLAQAAVDAVNAEKEFQGEVTGSLTESRIVLTLQALQQLGRYLAGVPGRKNVIWFSGSFPTGILPNPFLGDSFSSMRNFQGEIRKTSDLLAASQVAIYPIAAEGLASQSGFEVNNQEIGQQRGAVAMEQTMQQARTVSQDRDSSYAAMEEIAKDTGGKAFYNANGVSDALTRVVNNGSRYYSLTYSPTNPAMDGNFRRIQVKLNAKYTLAYRRGYYADDLSTVLASTQEPNSDPLLPLMGRNMPDYTQILYKILVQPSNPQPPADAPHAGSNAELKGPVTRYGVDFAVSVEDLKFVSSPDGVRHGDIKTMLVAYDREGKPLNLVVGRSEIKIPAKDYPNVQRGGLQIHKEIDIPGSDAFLRTGIYDLKSNNAGTLGVPLIDIVNAPHR